MKTGVVILLLVVLSACSASRHQTIPSNFPAFYKEGHRGTRGLMPENTIPAMIKAIEVGANVIEVDVYITKDGEVLIAHDPYINPNISLLPGGREVPKDSAQQYIWHQMNYAEIRKIDVGMKHYAAFPKQQKIPAWMPLLGELIDSVEAYTQQHQLPGVIYNIEIKSNPKYDGKYQPAPAVIVKKVMEVVQTKKIGKRFYIQSFDIRQLQETRKQYPHVTIGFLTDAKNTSVETQLQQIGFVPDIYSPHYKLVTPEIVAACKKQGMKLVPWTVNTAEEIQTLKSLGVNGIITDYPDLLQ